MRNCRNGKGFIARGSPLKPRAIRFRRFPAMSRRRPSTTITPSFSSVWPDAIFSPGGGMTLNVILPLRETGMRCNSARTRGSTRSPLPPGPAAIMAPPSGWHRQTRLSVLLQARQILRKPTDKQVCPCHPTPMAVRVRLVAADQALAASDRCPDGVPGGEFFYEHVHLRFDGDYELARTILPVVVRSLEDRGVKSKAGAGQAPPRPEEHTS